MINTTVFNHLPASFQFLHVCHYINSIGLLISNDSTSNKQYQTIPVLNALFDYLNQSDNETQAKQILLQKVLKGTDLYGGNENETLDTEYVNKTYHYIINKALFSHYGGITGYLAKIVNKASNLNFKDFEKTVKHHFSKRYKSNDSCSSNNTDLRLSLAARTKILEDYVLSIFPQPEQDLNITDVNYIYAMAGFKIVKTLPIKDQLNLTFNEYIQLSRSIEITASENKAYQVVLEFFSTPALFFYASKEKMKFKEQNLTSLNSEFWNDAYQMLFSYLNETVEMLVQDALKNSLHYKLQTDISKIKTRTAMAEMFLKITCPNVTDPVSLKYLIARYKSQSVSGALLSIETLADLIDYYSYNCSNLYLPNLNQLFYTQFDNVKNTYYEIEKNSIQQALVAGGLLSKINSPNTSVEKAKLPDLPSFCNTCGPNQRSIDKDIYFFFAIKQDSKTEFYALQQEESTLTLIKNGDNEDNFAQALGVDSSIKPQTEPVSFFLKKQEENSTVFVERLAQIKTDQYISQLQEYYYERTLVEKVMNHLISLVPFYTCVSGINSKKAAEAVLSCSVDILSLAPVAGVATKYLTLIRNSLSFQMSKAFTAIKVVLRGGVNSKVAIRTGVSEIFQAARTVNAQILSQPIIRDLSIALIRTMDPGVEIFYSLSHFGIRFLRKLFNNILLYTKSFKSFRRFSAQLKLMRSFLLRVGSKNVDHTGMVSRILARKRDIEVVRYTYPAGINSFGPKCFKAFGYTAELRTSFEDSRKIPVVPLKIHGDDVYYKKIDLESGKLIGHELMLDNNDLLQRIKNTVKLMEMEALGNQIRNYDVYYNTIGSEQPLKKKIQVENREDASTSSARNEHQEDVSEGQKGNKPDTSLQENPKVDTQETDVQAAPPQNKEVLPQKGIDDKIGSDRILESEIPTGKILDTILKRGEESGFDIDSFIAEQTKELDKYDLEVPENNGLGTRQDVVATGQEQNGKDLLRTENLQGKEGEALEIDLNVPDKGTRIEGMDTDEFLDDLLKDVEEHDCNLQSCYDLVEGATGQEKNTAVAGGSNIEAQEPDFDIDEFVAERSKKLDYIAPETHNSMTSKPNSVKKLDKENNLKMINDLRRHGSRTESANPQEMNVGSNPRGITDINSAVVTLKIDGGVVYYKKVDLEKENLIGHEVLLDKNNRMRPINNSVKLMELDALGNQIRNHDVHHNPVGSNQPLKRKILLESREDASSSSARNKHQKVGSEGQEKNQADTSLQENQKVGTQETDIQAGPPQKKKVFLEKRIDDKIESDGILESNTPAGKNMETILKHGEASGFDIDSFVAEQTKELDKYGLEVPENNGLDTKGIMDATGQEQDGIDTDEFFDELLKDSEEHDLNLQKNQELTGATIQEKNTVAADGSNIEGANAEEMNVGLNSRPITDFNTVEILKNHFQQSSGNLQYFDDLERASDRYIRFRIIHESLSFHDYWLLSMQVMGNLPFYFESNAKAVIATYRLALAQSSQNWINEPIKLYRLLSSRALVQKYATLKSNDVLTIDNFMIIFDNIDIEQAMRKVSNKKFRIFYEISLSNQYGVADIERVIAVGRGMHVIPAGMEFRVTNVVRETTRGKQVLRIQLSDTHLTNELKLLNVERNLDKLSKP